MITVGAATATANDVLTADLANVFVAVALGFVF